MNTNQAFARLVWKYDHKKVEWSFPSSANAAAFGYSASGCWTVSVTNREREPLAVMAFTNEMDAIASARELIALPFESDQRGRYDAYLGIDPAFTKDRTAKICMSCNDRDAAEQAALAKGCGLTHGLCKACGDCAMAELEE
jgi:hypothetical protein